MKPLFVKEIPSNSGNHIMLKIGTVLAKLKVRSFKDKETGHIVAYSPSLDISGYGNTKKEAFDMLNLSIKETFTYLLRLSHKQQVDKLLKYGWTIENTRK